MSWGPDNLPSNNYVLQKNNKKTLYYKLNKNQLPSLVPDPDNEPTSAPGETKCPVTACEETAGQNIDAPSQLRFAAINSAGAKKIEKILKKPTKTNTKDPTNKGKTVKHRYMLP